MKYFLDTELHEYKKKPLFSKPINTIELISIGIVSEDIIKDGYVKGIDGTVIQKDYNQLPASDKYEYDIVGRNYGNKEYYAICKEFDLKAAWNNEWLRENVLKPICAELENIEKPNHGAFHYLPYCKYKRLINKYGKTRKQIAEEIRDFVNTNGSLVHKSNGSKEQNNIVFQDIIEKYGNPEFYGYYSDYDWVVFCWLFGRMIDLPTGFPMYCIDLKQILDNKQNKLFKTKMFKLEESEKYPTQQNEHNALADAKWNYELYKFLNTL